MIIWLKTWSLLDKLDFHIIRLLAWHHMSSLETFYVSHLLFLMLESMATRGFDSIAITFSNPHSERIPLCGLEKVTS